MYIIACFFNVTLKLHSGLPFLWNSDDVYFIFQHTYVPFPPTSATYWNWCAFYNLTLQHTFDSESVLQCSNFLHCYVYRHANLCSGLRAILSPQLIKKTSQFFGQISGGGGNRSRDLTDQPTLESSVLPTELSRLVKKWGSNRKFILQSKYYVVLGMAYKAHFQKNGH